MHITDISMEQQNMERIQNCLKYVTQKNKNEDYAKVIKFSSVSKAFHSSIGFCMYEMILNDISLLDAKHKFLVETASDSCRLRRACQQAGGYSKK